MKTLLFDNNDGFTIYASAEFADITKRLGDEIFKAQAKHPDLARNLGDAMLVISEELGEAQRAYLQYQYEGGNWEEIRKELVQTGAMVFRVLLNLESYIEDIALERISLATEPKTGTTGKGIDRSGLGLLGLWMDEAAAIKAKPRIETDPVFKAMVEQKYRTALAERPFSSSEIKEAAKVFYGNYETFCLCSICREAQDKAVNELEAKLYGRIVKECEEAYSKPSGSVVKQVVADAKARRANERASVLKMTIKEAQLIEFYRKHYSIPVGSGVLRFEVLKNKSIQSGQTFAEVCQEAAEQWIAKRGDDPYRLQRDMYAMLTSGRDFGKSDYQRQWLEAVNNFYPTEIINKARFSVASGLGKTKASSVLDRRDVDYNERVERGNYPSLMELYAKHMGGEFVTCSRIGGEPGDVIATHIRVRKSRVTFARYYSCVSSDAACVNQFERWVKLNSPEGYNYSHSVSVRTPDDRIKRTVVYKRTKAGQK